ncbi:MAG: hypothetical protein FWF53_04450 [Candidatus Azobacteroides sp.]|nr:hypothetical protein [Candidatus Azobacteroides sp.]
MVKVELSAYNQTWDISGHIANIDDIEVLLERDGLNAVFKKTSFTFQFVEEAYGIVDNIFNQYRQFANASVYVYQRNDDFSYNDIAEIYELNFLTFSKTVDIIEVASRDGNLESVIKAKSNVVYDIDTVFVRDARVWHHDAVLLFNQANFGVNSIAEKSSTDYYMLFGNDTIMDTWGIPYDSPYKPISIGLYDKTDISNFNPTDMSNQLVAPPIDGDPNPGNNWVMFTVGGSVGAVGAPIKNVIGVGEDRPGFYTIPNIPDDRYNNGYICKAERNVTVNIEVDIRGVICCAWRTSTPDNGTWKTWGLNDASTMSVRVLLYIRRAGFNNIIPVIDKPYFTPQGNGSLNGTYSTGNNMSYGDNMSDRDVYWTVWYNTSDDKIIRDKIGGTYAKVIGNNMPVCFPSGEEMPPLPDNTFDKISAENVVLNEGDKVYAAIAVKLTTSQSNPNDDTDAWLYIAGNAGYGYWGSLYPSVSQYRNISPFFDGQPFMPAPPPSGKTSDQKFFFDERAWSSTKRSWLDGNIKIQYLSAVGDVEFEVTNPIGLMARLVGEMTQRSDTDVYIENMNTDTDDMDMLIAGESLIPDFENPKFHISFGSFRQWLETLGYTLKIDDMSVGFIKRINSFNANVQTLDITDTECEDLTESVDDGLIYGSVVIGYDKQTYEGDNARLEFNGTFNYAIDSAVNNNELRLISPVRADSIGLEIKYADLLFSGTRSSASTRSDKDVFVVNLRLEGTAFKQITTDYDYGKNTGQYNWKYNPRNLMDINSDIISMSGNICRFTASSANSEFGFNGIRLKDNIDMGEAYQSIAPVIYDFAVGRKDKLPNKSLWSGTVSFTCNGKILQGYIREISGYIVFNKEVQYKLYKKSDGWRDRREPSFYAAGITNINGFAQTLTLIVRLINTVHDEWEITDMPNDIEIVSDTDYKNNLVLNIPTIGFEATRKRNIDFIVKSISYPDVEFSVRIVQDVLQPEIRVIPDNPTVTKESQQITVSLYFFGLEARDIEEYDADPTAFAAATIQLNGSDALSRQIVLNISLNSTGKERQMTFRFRCINRPETATAVELRQTASSAAGAEQLPTNS